jgi:hypothetical protein
MDSPFDATPRRLSRETKKRVLSQNAAALYGLDLPADDGTVDDDE